jgi:hypothetical protein
MKTYLLFLSLFFFYESALSQSLSPQVLASGGAQVQDPSGISLSWTLGELSTELLDQGISLQQGFQQGAFSMTVQTQSSFLSDDQWQAFPNPVRYTLQVSTSFDQVWHYALFDGLGRGVLSGKNQTPFLQIDLPPLAQGLYWLQIRDASGRLAHKKIFIQQ